MKKIINKIENLSIVYIFLLYIFVGFFIYYKSLSNGFVWDDIQQIVENGLIKHLEYLPSFFMGSTFSGQGIYYRPLFLLWLSLCSFIGNDASIFHFFSLVLHIITTCIVFIFLKRMFLLSKVRYVTNWSLFLALIFLVHPTQVESVAYISAVSEILYVLFLLFSLLYALDIFKRETITKKQTFFLSMLILCSLFSKESGILAVGMLFLLAFFIFPQKLFYTVKVSIFTFGLYFFCRFFIANIPFSQHIQTIPLHTVSFFQRLLLIPYEIGKYTQIVNFPLELTTSRQEISYQIFDQRFILPTITSVVLVILMIYSWIKQKNNIYHFFLGWVCCAFLIHAHIIPLDFTIAERWMYVQLVGVVGCIGILGDNLIKKYQKFGKILAWIGLIILFFYSFRTMLRVQDWESNQILFSHDIQYEKESPLLYVNYGNILLSEKQYAQAQNMYLKSLSYDPYQMQAYNNLGIIAFKEHRYSQAKKYVQQAMKYTTDTRIYTNYADILIQTDGKQAAISFLEKSLQQFPQDFQLQQKLQQIQE